jgi:hypothetical protein
MNQIAVISRFIPFSDCPPAAVNPGVNGAGKNVGNRLYTNFGTASRFGPLLPFVERNKTNCLVSNQKSRSQSQQSRLELGLRFTH